MGEMIEVAALDGTGRFGAYRAAPSNGRPAAAIVVLQEIFGVNPGIRAKCDRWAELGYLALAPDMFWRLQPDVQLEADVPEERERAVALMQRFDVDSAVSDIEATIRAARAGTGGGKVGVVGFCLGGKLAYLAAARTDADASVGYYGVGLPALLGESHAIGRPLMLHIAADDGHVPPEQQQAIHAALDGNRHVTLYDYPGADHGFATQFGKRRNPAAAALADERTETFFAEHLV